MVVVQERVKTRKFTGTRVGLLRLRPTKGVFDPETSSIYTWTAPNLHHVGVLDNFQNKNIAHLLVYAIDRVIELQFPSEAPILLDKFIAEGGVMRDWYDYYCAQADLLFAKDVEILSELHPDWVITIRQPKAYKLRNA